MIPNREWKCKDLLHFFSNQMPIQYLLPTSFATPFMQAMPLNSLSLQRLVGLAPARHFNQHQQGYERT